MLLASGLNRTTGMQVSSVGFYPPPRVPNARRKIGWHSSASERITRAGKDILDPQHPGCLGEFFDANDGVRKKSIQVIDGSGYTKVNEEECFSSGIYLRDDRSTMTNL